MEEPRIDAQQILSDSGLVMVESKAPSQPVTQEEQQPLGRPRRERAKPTQQDDQLVQIETKR